MRKRYVAKNTGILILSLITLTAYGTPTPHPTITESSTSR